MIFPLTPQPKPGKKVKKKKKVKTKTIGKLKKEIEDLAKLRAKERDGYICQKCGKKVEGSNAHGSHVIPVSHGDALRFDLLNIKCLCYHCHINWWHKNPLEAAEWFKKTFPERSQYLEQHSEDVVKRTREDLELIKLTLWEK